MHDDDYTFGDGHTDQELADLDQLSVAVDEFRLADAATIIAQHDTASGKPRAGAA